MNIDALLKSIAELPNDWHGAGTVSARVLEKIVEHSRSLGEIAASVETGSGRTTLLLSHLSKCHKVFAIDTSASISQVKKSPLFNVISTEYIEGPTQRTIPRYVFTNKHQLVLLDGPHAYPFPDLEYYFLYPTIDSGGLLIVDDARIPSIGRMCNIIGAGDMFEQIDKVDDNTMFFRRTRSPMIDPEGDEWWLQTYNAAYYDMLTRTEATHVFARLLRWGSGRVPQALLRRLPLALKDRIGRLMWN